MLHVPLSLVTIASLVGVVEPPTLQESDNACVIMNERNFDARPSPLDSISFQVGGQDVKICYGRPSAKGRTMIGGEAVPFGTLWRTGANEPTMIHTSVALSFGGIDVEPGTYSVYTVPGESEWEVILNRSISQWGAERMYSDEVKAEEVGRGRVESQRIENHVETFTITAEPSANGAVVVMEWENTRVEIPVRSR